MRPYLLLIFTAVILAFFSGRYVLKFQLPGVASSDDVIEISKIKHNFQSQVTPYAIVNFSSLYYNDAQLDLLNPAIAVDVDDSYLTLSPRSCKSLVPISSITEFSKDLIWDHFKCRNLKTLPYWFFNKAPYMHSTGHSFAYLYYKVKKMQKDDIEWKELRSLLSYFHLKELSSLQDEVGPLGGIYGILAELDEESVYNLINRDGTILTKDYLLARINYPRALNILEYRFYLREDLNSFLESSPYQIANAATNKNCRYIDGPICWRYNVKHLFQVVNISSIISFLGVFLILIIILWLLFSKIKVDKLEELRRKMALQVLTHEFRTPVATLLLVLDKLNRRMDGFDEQTQDDLLLVSTEVYRLQRLTEKSKHYLQGQCGESLITFNFEKINNIADVVDEIIAPVELNYSKQVKVDIVKVPNEIELDLYWFQIIVKNLVENAFSHGLGQVELIMDINKDFLVITVKDEGSVSESLEDLTREFSKGNKSQGSGLGLSIVKRAIEEWGGKLGFKKAPTTFCVSLPLKMKRNV